MPWNKCAPLLDYHPYLKWPVTANKNFLPPQISLIPLNDYRILYQCRGNSIENKLFHEYLLVSKCLLNFWIHAYNVKKLGLS